MRNRFSLPRPTIGVLILTILILLFVSSLQSTERDRLEIVGLSVRTLQVAYVILIGILVLLIFTEKHLKTWLENQRWAALSVIILVIMLSVAWMLPLESPQSARLSRDYFSIWLVIIHGLSLNALIVKFVLPFTRPIIYRLSLLLLATLGILLVIFHIASRSEYMRFDVPDEPIVASIATNYALHNQLSPSFLASPYGTPDPAWGRFYLAMGIWLKILGDVSVASLRSFPLLIGALTVAVFAWTLRRMPTIPRLPALGAVVTLMSLSIFVRPAHNLRMDIGLGLYGVLALLGFLRFFNDEQPRKRWVVLMGLSLLIGLESVPTMALGLGMGIGCVLIIRFARQLHKWHFILLYALSCAVALGVYFIGQFWPDLADGYQRYQLFTEFYVNNAALSTIGTPLIERIAEQLRSLQNYHLRFNLILAPVEIFMIAGSCVALWFSAHWSDRWVLLTLILSGAITFSFLAPSYGYWVIFTPWIAYASIRMWRTPLLSAILGLVLIPALVTVPLLDMTRALVKQSNSREVADVMAISDWFPRDTTLLTESPFWFGLNATHNVIHWSAFARYGRPRGLSRNEVLPVFDPFSIIVWSDYESTIEWIESLENYGDRREAMVGSHRYYVYFKLETSES